MGKVAGLRKGETYVDTPRSLTTIPSPADLAQPTWFIDGSNSTGVASDSNTGTSASAPLLTLAELSNRWGKGNSLDPAGGTVTVTIMSSATASQPTPDFDVILDNSTVLLFVGLIQSTAPITGPFVVTVKDRTTNTPWKLQTGAPAANLVTNGAGPINMRLFDSTQNAYFFGWFNDPVGSPNTVSFSEPMTFPGLGNQIGPGNRVTPVNGDTFVQQFLPQVNFGDMRIGGFREPTPAANRPQIIFQDLCLSLSDPASTEPSSIETNAVVQWFYYGCVIPRSYEVNSSGGRFFYQNSFTGGLANAGGIAFSNNSFSGYASGVLSNTNWQAQQNGFYTLDMDLILEASQTNILGPIVEIGTCGVFDSRAFPTGDGIVSAGSFPVQFQGTLNDSTAAIWGVNPGFGIRTFAGSLFEIAGGAPPANLTVTGTLGDFSVASGFGPATAFSPDGVATANPPPGPNAVQVLGPFATTWANFTTPHPAGFGNNAINPDNGAQFFIKHP